MSKQNIQEEGHGNYYKLYAEKEWVRVWLKDVKKRAKRKGIKFNLTLGDIKVPEVCPVLGIKLERHKAKGFAPSIDRINPSLGYTKDNIRVISDRANTLKNNMTVEECKLILKDLVCLSL